MSIRSARVLQIIAACLFLLTLLVSVAGILFQEQIKEIYSPGLRGIFNIPYGQLLSSIALVCYGGLCLVLECIVKTPTATKVVSILLAVCYAILNIVVLPFIQLFVQSMTASESANAMASYIALDNGIGVFTTPLRVVGSVLSLFSLGGFYGKGSPGYYRQ